MKEYLTAVDKQEVTPSITKNRLVTEAKGFEKAVCHSLVRQESIGVYDCCESRIPRPIAFQTETW
jgi:hypothetical protein